MYQHIFRFLIWFILIANCILIASCYRVDLWSNGPIVQGASITFTAIFYDDDGDVAKGSFNYKWEDNAIRGHTAEHASQSGLDTWTVTYNASVYPPGPYVAQVTVCKYLLHVVCYETASNRIQFYINETLNGQIDLIQRNQTRKSFYVSNSDVVVHNISLKQTDADFVKNATTVLSYWFIDCTYYGFGNDLSFPFNYTQADKEHVIEALIVADFTPLPPPTTTTSTTTTTTTSPRPTTKTTTTSKPKTTTPTTTSTTTTTKHTTASSTTRSTTKNSKSQITTTGVPKSIAKRSLEQRNTSVDKNETSQITVMVNGTLVPYNGSFPYICNSSTIATDPKKTYGYFSKKIKVRAPVSKVNVTGNNWLRHGELLTLNVKCQASKNLKYCVHFAQGIQNITGNETCPNYHQLEICEFTVQRYFLDATEYTVILIIENEVSKIVTPVAVKIYEVKKQAQLSVIVVPVAFSLVAVVLIVFGVAYYLQNRSRFVVEVADFHFGQNYSDMEYKTFKERLRDSIVNAFFTRGPSPGSSEVPVWPPGRKYGSMTS